MAREVAKAADAKRRTSGLPSRLRAPGSCGTSAASRRTAPPAPRRPPPAQAAYIPPVQPLPPPAASVQAAGPTQLADDGQPVVRPPMPVR